MKVKNIRDMEYFTSTDKCKITETFGLPTEKIKEASVAFAILPSAQSTDLHHHNFLEWYIVTNGKAVMTITFSPQSPILFKLSDIGFYHSTFC